MNRLGSASKILIPNWQFLYSKNVIYILAREFIPQICIFVYCYCQNALHSIFTFFLINYILYICTFFFSEFETPFSQVIQFKYVPVSYIYYTWPSTVSRTENGRETMLKTVHFFPLMFRIYYKD